jgi:hypothetical protein
MTRESAMVILDMVKGGSVVKKNDIVARIDGEAMAEHVENLTDTIKQAGNDVLKRRDEHAVEWENLQQSLRVAKSAMEKARLDYQAAEVRTTLERQLLRLTLEQAEVRYAELQKNVPLRRQVHQLEMHILQMTQERHTRHRNRHDRDLERFTVRAPMDGLVVIQTVMRGGEATQVQQGDQLQPGQPVMKIVNPRSMQVEGSINQAQASLIALGQQVRVGFDGIEGLRMKGRVTGVGALAVAPGRRPNYYIRTVPVRISIEDQDSRVLPDLSAWGDITVEKVDAATQIPISAIHDEGGRSFIYVRSGEDFQKREVQLGFHNDTHVAITAGLSEGEEVRLN